MKPVLCVGVSSLIFFGNVVTAEIVDFNWPFTPGIENSVVGLTEAPIRTSPPMGWVSEPGSQVGAIEENGKYAIVGATEVPRFFETDVWVQVAPIGPDGTPYDATGWVYWGTTTDTVSPNFLPELNSSTVSP